MYKLSDKESADVVLNSASPFVWLTLKNSTENEVTDAIVKRAYAAVSCRNPLLRAVYKPEVAKFSLVVRDVSEIIQDEADGKLPAHLTREFHTRAEAWAEYNDRIESKVWKCSAMWEVTVCVLDKDKTSDDADIVVFGHFNHGITDGAAIMEGLSEFVRVLNAGLAGDSATLPPHNFLGESMPIPKPFLERYPLFKFDDPTSDDEKEALFGKVKAKLSRGRTRCAIADKSFTEEATRRFIAKCKEHGVSVTAGFFAAVAISASAKKFFSSMPISFRTKDEFGDFAVSFTDGSLSLDLTPVWDEERDEDGLWAALAQEFHGEIRKKLESKEEFYRGSALGFVHASLAYSETSESSMCTGSNNDEFGICMSNVGIVDKYFVDEKDGVASPLSVMEVTSFCTNPIAAVIVFWCYTFRGKFRIAILDSTYTPRKETFRKFTDKIFEIIEKN